MIHPGKPFRWVRTAARTVAKHCATPFHELFTRARYEGWASVTGGICTEY
jgi:hypothetical protein